MDPNTVLIMCLESLADGDPAVAAVHAEDLLQWIDKGGLLPTLEGFSEEPQRNLLSCFCFGVMAGEQVRLKKEKEE